MRYLDTSVDSPDIIRGALTARDVSEDTKVEEAVKAILQAVKTRGDEGVLEYVRRLDWPGAETAQIAISQDEMQAAEAAVAPELMATARQAAENIRRFHEAERGHLQSWIQPEAQGISLGQILQPVERVGIYVPGGLAAYPSTVLMTAIPAAVAGVSEIVLCTPPNKDGRISPLVTALAAPYVSRIFRIGGAQAIGAMAYGTETVPKVDVIVGPGNHYVNVAKRLVYGEVGIDMLAGPSEVAIVADETADPALVAADLLAQTEHGPENRAVLLSPSAEVLTQCQKAYEEQRATLKRQEILAHTAENQVFIKTNTLAEALHWVNVLAPEHLELMVRDPLTILPQVRNAGAILLGNATSAPLGDYWAGPSHTLPTAGAARFSSPLSVDTFLKRSSVLYYSAEAAAKAAEGIAAFAEAEGFDAHARAARMRASGQS